MSDQPSRPESEQPDYTIFQPKQAAQTSNTPTFSFGATSWRDEPVTQPQQSADTTEPAPVSSYSQSFRPQSTGYRSALSDAATPEAELFARSATTAPAAATLPVPQTAPAPTVEMRQSGIGKSTILLVLLTSVLLSSLFGALAGYGVYTVNSQQAEVARRAAEKATPQQLPAALDDSLLVSMIKRSNPAVVTVINQLNTRTGQASQPEALGSGFVFRKEGYILTNNHVIENQKQLYVLFPDGKQAPATFVGGDRYADLAVIKIDEKDVPAVLEFGDSGELQAGQRVFAIGSALGDFRNSVTQGIVSGTGRVLPLSPSTRRTLDDLIQTDTPINHGNSGGPLLNTRGQVIGINTAIMRYPLGLSTDEFRPNQIAEGIGFAVPSNLAINVSERLINEGKVARPFIGVSYEPFTPATARRGTKFSTGVLVTVIQPNSPADQAGLQKDDVIQAINDTPITEDQPMNRLLMRYKVGDEVKLTILRNDKQMTFTLKLSERPAELDSRP